MLTFIGAAQKEKSCSQLQRQMQKAVQQPDNTPVQLFIKVLKLREKLRKAAIKEGSLQFNDEQVRELFLHTLRTGIRDLSVKARIESKIAKGSTVSDAKIITQLEEIAAEEETRLEKVEANDALFRTKVKVREISVPDHENVMYDVVKELQLELKSLRQDVADMRDCEDDSVAHINEAVVSSTTDNGLIDLVKELQLELKSLRTDVADLKANKSKRTYSCSHCKSNNKGHSCRHCFSCGAGDHKIQDCPKRQSSN